MRCYLVLKPTEKASAQQVQMYNVDVTEHYEKSFMAEYSTPLISGDSDEPERNYLDSRDIKEALELTGYVSTKTEVDNLRTNLRTWCDSDSGKPSDGDKQGASIDVFLTSNFQSGGTDLPVMKTTYPDDGSTTVWTSAPNTVFLEWRFGTDSGAGFITRLRIEYESDESNDVVDYPARWKIQMTLVRGLRLA